MKIKAYKFIWLLSNAEPEQIIILGLIIAVRYCIIGWLFLPGFTPTDTYAALFKSAVLVIFWIFLGYCILGFFLCQPGVRLSFLSGCSIFTFFFLLAFSIIIPGINVLYNYFKTKGYPDNTIFILLDFILFILLTLIFFQNDFYL